MKSIISLFLIVLLLTSCALNGQYSSDKEPTISFLDSQIDTALDISKYEYGFVRIFKKDKNSIASFYLDEDNTLWKSKFNAEENAEYGFKPTESPKEQIMKNVEHIIGSKTSERNYLLVLTENQELYGFGSNVSGALLEKYIYPTDTTVDNWVEANQYPSPKLLMQEIVYTSTEQGFVMTLKSDGTLWGWGNNLTGQVGNGQYGQRNANYTFDMPFIVDEPHLILDNVVMTDTDGYTGIALKEDGSLWTWGDNSRGLIGNGQKGNGYPTSSDLIVLEPIEILDNIQDVWFGGS